MTNKSIKQFQDFKAKHPDALFLFRCGDCYESYGEDAKKAAKALVLTVTKASKDGTPIAGFPFHALDINLPKLIRAGHRVAICDPLEAPKQNKQPAKRCIKELATSQPKPAKKVKLPSITREHYDLLCECIRYRSADNSKERTDAAQRGQFTAWYDDMEKKLSELKGIIYGIK